MDIRDIRYRLALFRLLLSYLNKPAIDIVCLNFVSKYLPSVEKASKIYPNSGNIFTKTMDDKNLILLRNDIYDYISTRIQNTWFISKHRKRSRLFLLDIYFNVIDQSLLSLLSQNWYHLDLPLQYNSFLDRKREEYFTSHDGIYDSLPDYDESV